MINRKWSYFSSAWTLDWLPANTLHIQTEHCRAANSSVLRQDCVNIDNLLEFPVRQCIQNLFFCQNFNFYSCTVIFPWSEGEIKNIYIHLALVKDDPSMRTKVRLWAHLNRFWHLVFPAIWWKAIRFPVKPEVASFVSLAILLLWDAVQGQQAQSGVEAVRNIMETLTEPELHGSTWSCTRANGTGRWPLETLAGELLKAEVFPNCLNVLCGMLASRKSRKVSGDAQVVHILCSTSTGSGYASHPSFNGRSKFDFHCLHWGDFSSVFKRCIVEVRHWWPLDFQEMKRNQSSRWKPGEGPTSSMAAVTT